MSFAPPAEPPVPEGWKAQFDERYGTWFFVDLATGKSQWEKPETLPVHSPPVHSPPAHSPPPYNAATSDPTALAATGEKSQMGSNNPYNQPNRPSVSPNTMDEDARLAAKLQAEEDARGSQGISSAGQRGASDDYYNSSQQPGANYAAGPSQSPMPQQEQKRSKGGFLSKLMGKSSSKLRPQQHYPQQHYPQQHYPQQHYPQQGPPQSGPYYGGYPPQPRYGQQPSRMQGSGMGTAGAAALGVGGGLLGGMLIADAIEDHNDHDDYGGDYGGDDYGGGDFGGDF